MEPVILRVAQSVDIAALPAVVFALITDAAAYAVLLRERTEALRITLKRELHAWLEAIKRHLEASRSTRGLPQT